MMTRPLSPRGAGISLMKWLSLILSVLLLSGCMIRDAYRQMSEADNACMVRGSLADAESSLGPYVVAVVDAGAIGELAPASDSLTPVDFFVLEQPGEWVFALAPGRYQLMALRKLDGSLVHQADEPMVMWRNGEVLRCRAGDHLNDVELELAVDSEPSPGWRLNLTRQRDSAFGEQALSMISLGQATSFGEVTTLDHARFSLDIGRDSLWRPVDFMRDGHAGVYFLEPYDPARIPVLFVHGINGSPRVFAQLIESLDRERFQPWVYYYPSAIGLNENAEYLTHIMVELELRHDLKHYHVVAHSMGGLVSRRFLQNRQQRQASARVGHFIALSAPWGGHGAATRAVESSPLVLPVWKDMAAGSVYLDQIFSDPALSEWTTKHLLFSYAGGDGMSWGATTDGVITLASLLRRQAQDSAATIYGFDVSHIGILSDPEAIDRVNRLLSDLP